MFEKYGIDRVIEPKFVLPTSAWRLDNSREIGPGEMRVSVKRIHIEGTNFRQLCVETDNNVDKIKERIMDIVFKRGKLHNPVTDTAGVLFGTVEEIGTKFDNPSGLRPGDQVICNVSMANVPLYINRITAVDMAYSQIEVEGYAIIFPDFPLIPKPEDIPIDLLLYTLDESGTLYSVYQSARGKKRCLVVGNGLLTNILFGHVIRKAAPDAEIICLFDKNSDIGVRTKEMVQLMEETFTSIHYVNILKPVECLEKLDAGLFDLSINCADLSGAETINIMSTKPGGTVYFANMVNNYNIALYITEAISRRIEIRCADGFHEDYADFDIEILREIYPYLKESQSKGTTYTIRDNVAYSLRKNRKVLQEEMAKSSKVDDFICSSKAMNRVLEEILSVSKYDCNVLISGDTGVGKEKVASIIQKNSSRNMQPYVKINCASISEKLIESELFGYEKGAFTGANSAGKKGYFEIADNGIIFLDEVGELPLEMQAKLLRVIQDGEFYRVGGTKPVKCNVRILAATNRNLLEMVESKTFRQDLYYRLNVFPIRVPSLNERRTEIPELVQYFLKKYNDKFGTGCSIAKEAVAYMEECDWPGNIRELENTIQRLMISTKGDMINIFDVMHELHAEVMVDVDTDFEAMVEGASGTIEVSLQDMVDNFEKKIIEYACGKYGSTRKAAKAIGISQTQLVRKKKKYGIASEELLEKEEK